VLDSFWEKWEECNLFDLGFSEHPFMLWNRQEGTDAVEERLDRYCANGD